jgi:hypothetical protein
MRPAIRPGVRRPVLVVPHDEAKLLAIVAVQHLTYDMGRSGGMRAGSIRCGHRYPWHRVLWRHRWSPASLLYQRWSHCVGCGYQGRVPHRQWCRRARRLAEAAHLSIVVLPFTNLTGDQSQDYNADMAFIPSQLGRLILFLKSGGRQLRWLPVSDFHSGMRLETRRPD